jgi:BCD family chlorophyll transporter-like MFS transporter
MIRSLNNRLAQRWGRISTGFLPFAEIATAEMPLSKLLRLALFQVTVGMTIVLLIGTLNRVMIVELGVKAWVVALMVSAPLIFAPLRAIIGFKSDNHASALGWRRVPYLWLGTMAQFGGLAIMPFSLIILSGDTTGPIIVGQVAAALSFFLVGAGMHTVQTVGLALATDLTPPKHHVRVVVLLSVMLLLGMVVSAGVFGLALHPFSEIRLIQVVQGAAAAVLILNTIALWKQEPRQPGRTKPNAVPSFAKAWAEFSKAGRSTRRLVAVACGTAAFSMGDILLEPYGGQILHLPVAATTALTALLAVGGLLGFGLAARALARGSDPYRLAALGALAGLVAFSAVIFAEPAQSAVLFGIGTLLIGFGGGLFAVGTLMATIDIAATGQNGLALGAWGAAQASAAGIAIALGGLIRDGVGELATSGALGEALASPGVGYSVVYHIELYSLFITLVALGPLVRARGPAVLPLPSALAALKS